MKQFQLVNKLIISPGCIVLLTGPTDYLSDGARTVAIHNGHPLLGQVTGVCFYLFFFFFQRSRPLS